MSTQKHCVFVRLVAPTWNLIVWFFPWTERLSTSFPINWVLFNVYYLLFQSLRNSVISGIRHIYTYFFCGLFFQHFQISHRRWSLTTSPSASATCVMVQTPASSTRYRWHRWLKAWHCELRRNEWQMFCVFLLKIQMCFCFFKWKSTNRC